MLPRKTSLIGIDMPVPKTDTGGRAEKAKGSRLTSAKELGKIARNFGEGVLSGVVNTALGSRSDKVQATVYQKHRTLRTRKEDV